MTPNAFQGVMLNGFTTDPHEPQRLHYLVGYLDKIKERNSDRLHPHVAGGRQQREHGDRDRCGALHAR